MLKYYTFSKKIKASILVLAMFNGKDVHQAFKIHSRLAGAQNNYMIYPFKWSTVYLPAILLTLLPNVKNLTFDFQKSIEKCSTQNFIIYFEILFQHMKQNDFAMRPLSPRRLMLRMAVDTAWLHLGTQQTRILS